MSTSGLNLLCDWKQADSDMPAPFIYPHGITHSMESAFALILNVPTEINRQYS